MEGGPGVIRMPLALQRVEMLVEPPPDRLGRHGQLKGRVVGEDGEVGFGVGIDGAGGAQARQVGERATLDHVVGQRGRTAVFQVDEVGDAGLAELVGAREEGKAVGDIGADVLED